MPRRAGRIYEYHVLRVPGKEISPGKHKNNASDTTGTSATEKRYNFPEGTVELYVETVELRGLCAIDQCESLRCRLNAGHDFKSACNDVLRFIMESGAKGCEVVVSGQSGKSMKFTDSLIRTISLELSATLSPSENIFIIL
ncbi:40S ribosomal protein S3 [Nucella lapillus]